MKVKLYPYDSAKFLTNEEAIAAYMNSAFETGDSVHIAKALGVVARAKGMNNISQQADLSREQLYRSLSEQGNPTLKTILAVMQALGFDLMIKAHTTV